jgi:hypothetical protein
VKPPDEILEIIADNLDSRMELELYHKLDSEVARHRCCGRSLGSKTFRRARKAFRRALEHSAAPVGSRHTLAAGLGKIFSSGELHMTPEAQEEIERKIGQSPARSRLAKPCG